MAHFHFSITLNIYIVKHQVVAVIEAIKILNEFTVDTYKMNWKI